MILRSMGPGTFLGSVHSAGVTGRHVCKCCNCSGYGSTFGTKLRNCEFANPGSADSKGFTGEFWREPLTAERFWTAGSEAAYVLANMVEASTLLRTCQQYLVIPFESQTWLGER